MFRVKLLAVVISIFAAFSDGLADLEPETTSPPDEKTEVKLMTPLKDEKVQEYPPQPEVYTVSATVYYPEKDQTDAYPLITADGSRINPRNPAKHRWIALSRDMLARWGGDIEYGDSVWVRGISEELDGMYIVRDTMNRRFRNRIDILVGRHDNIYGLWRNVEVARTAFPEEEKLEFIPDNFSFAMSK